MSNEERLRKALQSVKYRLQYSDHTKASRELADIVDYIDHKLRSIDRRPEMDRLVEWLEEHANNEIPRIMRIRHRQPMPYTFPMRRGLLTAYRRVLHYIREMKEQP